MENNSKRWTEAQQLAINLEDNCSIMVSAAAGSGKTTVLVERLVQRLSLNDANDPDSLFPADRLVVSTYTKASASDMKLRLTKRLNQAIEQNPNNEWLLQQHTSLQNAKISTIHSFCFDLIRENINCLDVSTGFKVIEETEERVLLLKAIQETLDEQYNDNLEDMTYLSQVFCRKTDTILEKTFEQLYRFLMSVPFFEDWLKINANYYSIDNMKDDEYLKYFIEEKAKYLQKALEYEKECYRIYSEFNQDVLSLPKKVSKDTTSKKATREKYLQYMESEISSLEELLEIMTNPETRYNYEDYALYTDFTKNTIRVDQLKKYDESLAVKFKSYRELFKNYTLKEVIEIETLKDIIENYSVDKETNRKITTILTKIVVSIHEKFTQLKIEENVLTFSDAEQLALKLLTKKVENIPESSLTLNNYLNNYVKSELAEELSEYYKIIMIDEFQDANNNQDLIFKMLSKGGTAERMGNNVFVVGDVKQAIYGFRLANPQNFNTVREYSQPYDPNHHHDHVCINLKENFRSSKEIIDFANFTFENLMSKKVGDIEYNQDERLNYSANFPSGDRATEIALIDGNMASEAEYIARTIKDMVDSQVPIITENGTRPCRQSDFCMLFNYATDVPIYFDKLQEYGLNVNFKKKSDFLKTREVSLLFNMLKVVDNPMDNISMVSVMMSPMFLFTPDDVSRIRLIDRHCSIYLTMKKVAEDINYTQYSKPLVDNVNQMLTLLDKLRNLSINATNYELLNEIIDATDYISNIRVYDNPEARHMNVQIFLKLARDYDSKSNNGITGFIRYINGILDNKQDINLKINFKSNDGVNINTIHISKGLEYPFVFLCNCHKMFNITDINNNKVFATFNNGLAYRLVDKHSIEKYSTLDFLKAKELKLSELKSEKMRLMYVALTRAKEKLFIPLALENISADIVNNYINTIQFEKCIPSTLTKKANCMLEWFVMLLCCCDKAQKLRDFYGVSEDMDYMVHCNANVKIYQYIPPETALPMDSTSETVAQVIDTDLKETILKQCNFSYLNSKAELPARISVSELVKSEGNRLIQSTLNPSAKNTDNESMFNDLKVPRFTIGDSLTPAERGTTMHTIMERCDFTSLRENMHQEINNLFAKGYLTEEQLKVIDYGTFERLFNSEIFPLISGENVQRERDFLVRISELELDHILLQTYKGTSTMLQGCIDAVVDHGNSLTIIDYKTDNVTTMDTLKERYELQLQLYKSAISLIESRPVKALIYSMKLGKTLEI